MGDFNSHSPSWGYEDLDNKGEEVESWAIDQQLILINSPEDLPTYYSRSWRTSSTPDLAFTCDAIHKLCRREVCPQLGGSDHRPILLHIDQQTQPRGFNPAPSWNYKKADWRSFTELAERECTMLTLSETNMNKNAINFNKAILKAAAKSIPRGRRKNYNPSWSPHLARLQEDLNQARDKMERNPTDGNVADHNKAKAEFVREKLQQTRRSWHEKTSSLNMEKDSKKLWNLVKTLNDEAPSHGKTVLEVNKQLLTEKRAANEFAKFYKKESTLTIPQEKIRRAKEEIKIRSADLPNAEPCMHDLLKQGELEAAIRKLKTKKAPGPDGVSNDMLKHLGPIAKKTLLQIFNCSWQAGIVPEIWKKATIVPILKKGKAKTSPGNYRPISLLSCVGKLMERIVTCRLSWFLESREVLSQTQTGYRQHRSTEDQLAYISQEIENSFQEKRKLLAVFFDLSRAFDRVWKKGLQLKMLRAGVSSLMYRWISSFLYHRYARVKLDGSLSKQVRLPDGVPQGSVLSPVLFLLYINDITHTLPPRVSNSLHADDLAVWTSADHTTTATCVMQETVNRVGNWADEWCMEINCNKTQATLFTLSTSKERVTLKLKDDAIPQVEKPKFLGVMLDTRLTWKPHLEATAVDTTKKLSLLKKLAGTTWGADTAILRQVYTGSIRPVMEYAASSWVTASTTNKSRLDKVQNIALRAIVGAMKTTPIAEMEKRADIEPLETRRGYKVLKQTEKIRRLPGHPLHAKLSAPTKNRLKRQSLNHLSRALRKPQEDILDADVSVETNLTHRDWNTAPFATCIELEVPGLEYRQQQSPPAEKALTLAMLDEQYPCDNWTHIYTDGSADDAVKNGGCGVYVRTPTGQTHSSSRATGQKCSNFKAEVLALQEAVEYIQNNRPNKSVVLTDSKAALQSLTSESPDQEIRKLQKDLFSLPGACSVVLQWIPAHCGIHGNEKADQLAKTGSRKPQQQSSSTYREAKTLLNNRQKAEWKKAKGDYNTCTDPINHLQRSEQTAIFRLRTGHCGLRAHLRRIGVAASSSCDCGAEQTVHHVLQDCPLLVVWREQIWPQEVPTTTKLWGTAEDLRRTIQFTTSCGLRI